jgi:hypothetical protein
MDRPGGGGSQAPLMAHYLLLKPSGTRRNLVVHRSKRRRHAETCCRIDAERFDLLAAFPIWGVLVTICGPVFAALPPAIT